MFVQQPYPRSVSRLISRSADPRRARNRSFSRAIRHQRASHSRSLGLTNLARRAQPALKPAAASEQGFTANHRPSTTPLWWYVCDAAVRSRNYGGVPVKL